MLKTLLIATHNKGKVKELRTLLKDEECEILSLDDFHNVIEVDETGSTFVANARVKASGYATQTGTFALADDSGLEVEGLDGRPGIYSARYGGMTADFAVKMDLLLAELNATGDSYRKAQFVCAMALADPNGDILFTSEGICAGTIAREPRGSGGFGYDPIFIPDGFVQTFGELNSSLKQRISHRFRAFEQIIPFLRHFEAV